MCIDYRTTQINLAGITLHKNRTWTNIFVMEDYLKIADTVNTETIFAIPMLDCKILAIEPAFRDDIFTGIKLLKNKSWQPVFLSEKNNNYYTN